MNCPYCSSSDTVWKSKAALWECNACEERFNPIACPHCSSQNVIWKEKALKWECSECEARFEQTTDSPSPASTRPQHDPSPSQSQEAKAPLITQDRNLHPQAQRPKVFLSYGRKDALEVAKRLEQDLGAAGFEIWMDIKKIGSGSLWQQEIEDGLRESQVVVSLLSPHAVRRVGQSDAMDSVCLDELTFARTSSPPTPVVPAMIAPCEPPFIIYRLDYVHLMGWRESEQQYQTGLNRLISGIRDALNGKVNYRIWEDRLRPLDFSDYMARKRHGFVGREWLFEEINLWRFESDERALLITGDPGAGKSSIVAQLIHSNPDGQVIGYHCCQSNESETLRPARFVQSLAAMIASRVPAYAEQLEVPSVKQALEDKRCEVDPGGAFLEGILQPLQKIAPPEEGVRYILVDALDEALGHAGGNNIVEILATRIDRLPPWLRILATTRNEPAVIQRLSGLRAKSIDASDPRNIGDLAAYIHQRLLEPSLAERLVASRTPAEAAVGRICEKSAGNFLYAVNALDGIARDFYSFTNLDALPRGLDGLYLDFFRRIFVREGSEAGEAVYRKARPLLQVLCAAVEPTTRDELAAASNLDPDEELPPLMRKLAQLLSRRTRANGEFTVAFYHKSVADWLVSNPDMNAFAVSPAKGRKLLADFCRNTLAKGRGNPGWYVRRHAVEHFLAVEDWDSATGALSDLDFIQARAVAQELGMMLLDYVAAIKCFPEGETERRTEASRQAELDRYARDMVQYAAACSRIRDGSREEPPKLPRPVEQVRMWSREEIAAERKRITETPNRLDVVKAFRVFIASNSAPLQAWSAQEGFVAQLARNDAPAGPVHETGKRALERFGGIKLNKQFLSSDIYNPLDPCRAVFEGHTDIVFSVVLSSNGRLVISGSADNTLRVWNAESGECLKVFKGHTNVVSSVVFSSDGRLVISGSADNTLRFWEVESGVCLKVFAGHTHFVESVVVSADCRRAISGSADATLRVWDIESGECLKVLEGHMGWVKSVVLSADGHRVVSGSADATLRVWDVENGECVKVLEGHATAVSAVVLSADGRHVVSGSADATLRVWDIESGECLGVLRGHTKGVNSVVLSADGRHVVSGSCDRTLRVWDVESGECLKVLEGHQSGVQSVVLSADGRYVISGSRDRTLRVWNIESGEHLKVFQRHTDGINSLVFGPNCQFVISGSDDATLRVWDIESGEHLKVLEGHTDVINSVVFSSNCQFVISGSNDATLRMWDIESGECLKVLAGHVKAVLSLALSADGRRVISGSEDRTLRVWDVESGECFNVLMGHIFSVSTVLLSPDDHRLISGSYADTRLRVWDLESGECLKALEGHAAGVCAVGLGLSGNRAISGNGDKTLRVWDFESGECLKVLGGHTGTVTSAVVGPDGRFLISGSNDATLRVWDFESGECLKVLGGHTEHVTSAVFSPDGRLVISGSGDDTLRVWRAESGECLAVFFIRGKPCVKMSWSNCTLIAGLSDGTVRRFRFENLSLGPFITTAQREIRSEDLPAGPVTARPTCCGQRISIPEPIAERIEHFFLNSSETAYTDPALLLNCPSCGTPLRMNPFFIDIPAND